MEARACDLAEYLLANNTTVRAAAKKFGVSKSTVHKDLSERLALCDRALRIFPAKTETLASKVIA